MSREKNELSDMVALNELQKEIDTIFDVIQTRFDLSKEEYLALVALWDNGPMSMKRLNQYVDIKPYKRTRFFNNLVTKGWIYKERPANDERTVIIHYNEKRAADKEEIVNAACSAIKNNMNDFRTYFDQVLNICK
ncbi:transcriptional regulator, SarA/Rot family [Macrococcus bovicus]|uniref:MarR family transcriptional regulator n=1 Tax=Macrococcus bovicus TaxID=69968 RepID=A0A4V3BFJ6_9STAP|nr:MarR family transcriptional regulator [Macrococcus bovicus]TDM14448.1 MarR family transcriptional regulator [Macrococcus bovicus]WJP97231.1 MarR family transcriptional regulator [Macrococcus bovicus]